MTLALLSRNLRPQTAQPNSSADMHSLDEVCVINRFADRGLRTTGLGEKGEKTVELNCDLLCQALEQLSL